MIFDPDHIRIDFIILRYVYIGELDLTKQSGENILELLVASDELLLEELFYRVQDHLLEKCSGWIQRNLVLTLHVVFKLVNCKKLQDHCFKLICADPQSFL